MKYIKKFEENTENDSEVNLEEHKDEIEKVFETNNWLIIKPKTLEALYYWSQDQGWSDIENDIDSKYKHYDQSLGNIYININKSSDDKIFFDFHKLDFYGKDEDIVYLKDFFDSNFELLSYYGEVLPEGTYTSNGNVVKDGDFYWFVIDDYVNFEKYFKLDRDTRKDLIKTVLGGDSFDIFNYNSSDISIDSYNIDFNKENLILALK